VHVFVWFWFEVNLLRSEISGLFQVIEIVTDLLRLRQRKISDLLTPCPAFP